MDQNRLQHLRESAPGDGGGWLPEGMCKFSVIVIVAATAVAFLAAWAKASRHADGQAHANRARTAVVEAPHEKGLRSAKESMTGIPQGGDGKSSGGSAAEPDSRNGAAVVQVRASIPATP